MGAYCVKLFRVAQLRIQRFFFGIWNFPFMVEFEEIFCYSVGVFSIGYAIFYLSRYQDLLVRLSNAGIAFSADLINGILLAYFLIGFLGAGQIWLGLLHNRVHDLESEVDTLREKYEKP